MPKGLHPKPGGPHFGRALRRHERLQAPMPACGANVRLDAAKGRHGTTARPNAGPGSTTAGCAKRPRALDVIAGTSLGGAARPAPKRVHTTATPEPIHNIFFGGGNMGPTAGLGACGSKLSNGAAGSRSVRGWLSPLSMASTSQRHTTSHHSLEAANRILFLSKRRLHNAGRRVKQNDECLQTRDRFEHLADGKP